MKKIIFSLLITAYSIAGFSQNIDSVAAEIGTVKTISISNDTALITNLDGEQFQVVGNNIGLLIAKLSEGYDKLKEANPQKPLDYIIALLPWLLGGGITSVIAYATRALNGFKSIFNGIEKDYKIVLGVAGVLAFAWNVIQGVPILSVEFWGNFAMQWFTFGGYAFLLYHTILKRIMKSPKPA